MSIEVIEKPEITVEISTKNRYDILPQAIQSVILQTYTPKYLLIFDDGEHADLRKLALYNHLFRLLERKKITWHVIFGERKGQVLNHQKALIFQKTEFIWRLDDDNVAEPDVLERLVKLMEDPKVGAAAGCVLHPEVEFNSIITSPKIEDCLFKYAIQLSKFENVKECDHLYSTFLIRKSAAQHGYCRDLSMVGHREETIFTHEMKRAGYKLLVDGDAITWHLKHHVGGIRQNTNFYHWAHDEEIFKKYINKWGVELNKYKLILLDSGMGDHFCFKNILLDILNKYNDHEVFLAACYPDVFFDIQHDKLKLISLIDGQVLGKENPDNHNIYKFMTEKKWKKSLLEAYKELYGV